ncbi:Pickpocket protein 28 [Anthophora retusa]
MEPMKVEKLTEDGGLTVLLEPFLDDYFYPIFPSTGWKVTIFNPFDYPDMSSGGVFEMLVSPNMHRSVEIQAIMFYSSKSIVSFPVEKRDCVFADEMVTLRAFYTYSDCIVDCKIEDMWKLCGCIPFYLPNRAKWISVVPHEDLYNDESLNNSRILHCYKCYSECSDVRYDAKIATSDLLSDGNIFNILDNTELVDQGVLSVYFEQFGTVRLKQDVIYRWYELMSEASGVCGIFVGFSLIAVVEFAYFVGLFVLELLKGPASSDGKEKLAERKQAPVQTIYWGELFSNARTTKNQRDRARGKY